MSDVLLTAMALRNRNCRDLARGSGVQFVVDDILMRVVEIGVITTSRPITVTMTRSDATTVSRTQQPNITQRYNVAVDLITVTDGGVKGLVWPFVVQF